MITHMSEFLYQIMNVKVLFVAPYGGVPGGISRWTSHIIDHYKEHGHDDCQLGLVAMGRSSFVNIHMPLWRRLWSAWIDYRAIFRNLIAEIDNGQYDVMHLTSSGSLSLFKDIAMLKMARRKGLKCVIHFHFGRIPELSKQNNWEWRLLKKAVKLSDRAIVIDRASYDVLVSSGCQGIELLDNPIASQVVKTISENCDVRREDRVVLFTGHVVRTKGIFELLRACASIDGVLLKIVGHITAEMRQEIEREFGADALWYKAYGEMPYADVIKEMQKCDIFVLPTYTEGFPNVILESMAAGCAIISTPVGAIPQMLEDDEKGKYGLLVEPRDVKQLHDAIGHLLNDEPLKDEMRRNVQRRVNERYNIDVVWSKMLKIWKSCVS